MARRNVITSPRQNAARRPQQPHRRTLLVLFQPFFSFFKLIKREALNRLYALRVVPAASGGVKGGKHLVGKHVNKRVSEACVPLKD